MEVKFILGNTNLTNETYKEQAKYGDIVILPVHENINEGKTYYFFKWAYHKLKNVQSNAMVFKADMDTFLCYERFAPVIEKIDDDSLAYMGRMNYRELCGEAWWCPPRNCSGFDTKTGCWVYMSGGIYAVSLKLLRKIMAVPQEPNGYEDLTTAGWIRNSSLGGVVDIMHHDNGELWCHGSTELWYDSRASTDCQSILHDYDKIGNCTKR